ncbi:MAG: formate dehydrogenase subunit gamma [Actinomycetota bacterium]
MTTTTTTTLVRFDGVTRVVHWATAVLGVVALVTGTILYVPEFSAAVGMRATLKDLHVVTSLLLVVPLAVAAASGAAGRRLRADLIELTRWTVADRRWLRRRTRGAPAGKFNGGQKVVTALFAGLFVMQLLTGLIMFWPNSFPDAWRTGATFVHDWAYLGLAAAVVGHIVKAVGEPDLMRSMMGGTVPKAWADRERPTWRSTD